MMLRIIAIKECLEILEGKVKCRLQRMLQRDPGQDSGNEVTTAVNYDKLKYIWKHSMKTTFWLFFLEPPNIFGSGEGETILQIKCIFFSLFLRLHPQLSVS
jgi:hypothetical protein